MLKKKLLLFILIILQLNYSLNENLDKSLEKNNKNSSNNNANYLNVSSLGKIILFLFLLLFIFIIYTVIRNTEIKNRTLEAAFSAIKKNFKLKELDISPFEKITVYKIMTFHSKVNYIEGIGVLSFMTVNMGIMQMITFMIDPFEKDLPLLSMDFIYMFGKRKIIVEVYDLVIDKENNKYKNFIKKIEKINNDNSNLGIFELKKSWNFAFHAFLIHKSGTAKNDGQISNIFKESVESYIEFSKEMPELNKDDKEKKYTLIKDLSDQFIEKGGIAVNVFKKSFGEENTRKILGKICFGYLHFKKNKNSKEKNE